MSIPYQPGGKRWLANGYSIFDSKIPGAVNINRTFKINNYNRTTRTPGRSVKSTITGHFLYAAYPTPALDCNETAFWGILKRIASVPPEYDEQIMESLYEYTRKFCETNLVPLLPDVDISNATWLKNNKSYTEQRKLHMAKIFQNTDHDYLSRKAKHTKVKHFTKEESYPEYKAPRGIFPRSEAALNRYGPVIACISESVWKLPQFIKKIPVGDRSNYIKEYFSDIEGVSQIGDFVSYEASFVKKLMNVAFILYKYMTQNHPEAYARVLEFESVVTGVNTIEGANFVVSILCGRMSGEVDTSVANGFTTLMVIGHVHERFLHTFRSLVEGDDNNTKSKLRMTPEMFLPYGLNIKIFAAPNEFEGGFCGMQFDPEANTNIIDPVKVILKSCWSKRQYNDAVLSTRQALTKSVALCRLHEAPGCPIVQEFAAYLLRMTYRNRANFQHLDYYELEQKGLLNVIDSVKEKKEHLIKKFLPFSMQLAMTPYKPVQWSTRLMMHRLYKITPDEQIRIEKFFRDKTDDAPFFIEEIYRNCHADQIDYYNRFVYEDMAKPDGRFTNCARDLRIVSTPQGGWSNVDLMYRMCRYHSKIRLRKRFEAYIQDNNLTYCEVFV